MAADNKTEQATPRRRQKAREKGQVVRSRDLVASSATMCGLLALSWQLSTFPQEWRHLLRGFLEDAATTSMVSPPHVLWIFHGVAFVLALTWIVATAVGVGQGGLVFAPSALAPSWARLSPATRVRELFSLTAVARLVKSLLPATLIVYLAVSILMRDWGRLAVLFSNRAEGFTRFLLSEIFEFAWKSSLVLLGWAVADYLIQRHKFEGDLRMSRQDLVDEYKETEGNPTVKARIRRLQRQVRRQRMLKDVERAAVVITNPVRFAVALEFKATMTAPVVVAKGRNLLAAEIKQVARWHGIPLVENPPLAHALYRAVEIGQSIPPKLYRVVAEVLAAIYRIQSRYSNAPTSREGVVR